jgi:arginyl-tRNA--protein-N-Asp/Glu arginylyltransferase
MDKVSTEALTRTISELYLAMIEAGVTEEQIKTINKYFEKRHQDTEEKK